METPALHIGQTGTTAKFEIEIASLTKHAIILGATGSGKTVLAKAIVEEAALSSIPTFAIDPKGDIGNLAFKSATFDFSEWSGKEADALKIDRSEYVKKLQKTYSEKAKEFGVSADAAKRLEKIKVRIFTPKSSSGLPVGISPALAPPDNFSELLSGDVASASDLLDLTAFSLLRQVGYAESDRKEITLVSALLENAWKAERNLTVSELVKTVETPPAVSIGHMPVGDMMSDRERHKLATKINLLISDPKLRPWSAAEPLNFTELFAEPSINVLDLRHIQSEKEKHIFIETVLQQLFQWLIKQGSAQTLRYLLYFDEIAGYCPPIREPPSKKLLLLLIKQARAFGLGLVLASQNAVDLDYKVISNANVRFIGRLGAQRDIQRVSTGLELGSYAEREIARLQPGEFYCNVFAPKFQGIVRSRWPLTYHRGPLENSEIAELMKEFKEETSLPDSVAAPQEESQGDRAETEVAEAKREPQPDSGSDRLVVSEDETFLLLPSRFKPENLAGFIKLGNNLKSLKVLSSSSEEKLHPIFELKVSISEKSYAKQSLEKVTELCEIEGELLELPTDYSPTKSRAVGSLLRAEARQWEGQLSKRLLQIKSDLEQSFDILLEERRRENISERSARPKKKIADLESKQMQIEEAIRTDEEAATSFARLVKEAKKNKSKARVISLESRIAGKKQKVSAGRRRLGQIREDRRALEQEIRDIESDEKTRFHTALCAIKSKSGYSITGWLVEVTYRARILVNDLREHGGDVQWSAFTGRGTWGRCFSCSVGLSEGSTCACGNLMCNSHLAYCKFCLEPACKDHRLLCYICNSIFCTQHSGICEICRSPACLSHSATCSVCNRHVCNNCSTKKGIIKREVLCADCSRK